MKLEIKVPERKIDDIIWEEQQTIFATVLSVIENSTQDSSQ